MRTIYLAIGFAAFASVSTCLAQSGTVTNQQTGETWRYQEDAHIKPPPPVRYPDPVPPPKMPDLSKSFSDGYEQGQRQRQLRLQNEQLEAEIEAEQQRQQFEQRVRDCNARATLERNRDKALAEGKKDLAEAINGLIDPSLCR